MMAVLLPSCLKDDKDIFDKSSADRMTEAMIEYQQALESSPNGWLMSYFPGRDAEKEVTAGYNYLVKFKNGEVTAAADFSITNYPSGNEISSLYRIIADEGPVLTFDSYNHLLHNFCTPSSSSPYGSRADYEFTILSASSDSIVLRGKLYRNKIYMTPIAKDKTWTQCLANITNIRNIIADPQKLNILSINGKEIEFEKLARGFIIPIGDNDTRVAYRCTEDGIQFYKPILIEGKNIQNFKYVDGKFKCTDSGAEDVTIDMKDMPFFRYQINSTQWWIVKTDVSPALDLLWTKASNSLPAAYGPPLTEIYLGLSHHSSVNGTALVFGTMAYWGVYSYKFTFSGDDKGNEFSLAYLGDGLNGAPFKPYFLELMNIFQEKAPYTLTTDSYTAPTYIHFESKNDPTIYFTAYK